MYVRCPWGTRSRADARAAQPQAGRKLPRPLLLSHPIGDADLLRCQELQGATTPALVEDSRALVRERVLVLRREQPTDEPSRLRQQRRSARGSRPYEEPRLMPRRAVRPLCSAE